MQSHGEKAKALFLEGYNCTQAVVGAFYEEMGLNKEQALRMASPFGGGMGRLREVCGTFSGILIVLGYFYGYDDPKDYEGKKELYAKVQELAGKFKEDNGSIICKELLGLKGRDTSPVPEKRTEDYYKKRPCPELAAYAANLLEKYLETHAPEETRRRR